MITIHLNHNYHYLKIKLTIIILKTTLIVNIINSFQMHVISITFLLNFIYASTANFFLQLLFARLQIIIVNVPESKKWRQGLSFNWPESKVAIINATEKTLIDFLGIGAKGNRDKNEANIYVVTPIVERLHIYLGAVTVEMSTHLSRRRYCGYEYSSISWLLLWR